MKLFSVFLVMALSGCGPAASPPSSYDCAGVCEKFKACPSFQATPGPLGPDGQQHPVECKVWLCRATSIKISCLLENTVRTCDQAEDAQQHGNEQACATRLRDQTSSP